jgi:hypothetical protein
MRALGLFFLVFLGLAGRLWAVEPGAPLVTAGPLAGRIVLDGLLGRSSAVVATTQRRSVTERLL